MPTYPGVYVEELSSGVRTITGVATSITAFLGRAKEGPVNEPTIINNFGDYERQFGGLWKESTMSYAVKQFFLNGGAQAIVVRLVKDGVASTRSLSTSSASLNLVAANEGEWADPMLATVDHDTKDKDSTSPDLSLFNLTLEKLDEDGSVEATETFLNLSVDEDSDRYVVTVLEQESDLVRVSGTVPSERPLEVGDQAFSGGSDGGELEDKHYQGSESDKTGIYALDQADLFNLLCIPPYTRDKDVANPVWTEALKYCKKRRAILIVDPPSGWNSVADVLDGTNGVDSLGLRDENTILYFPRVRLADALQENRLDTFAPCGVMAGLIARIDSSRGFWKAPAGTEATLTGVSELPVKMTDDENGQLNPQGVNCLRAFPVYGRVSWGARTLEGADRLASEWKYLSVRRVALYIEESLYRGLQWVVFEPNDHQLWSQIRLNVGAFMHGLFRKGAFQGISPKEAYFVKCDSETTTQNDIDLGIVNIIVGFAPLKPAEFVIIKLQQIAGQVEV